MICRFPVVEQTTRKCIHRVMAGLDSASVLQLYLVYGPKKLGSEAPRLYKVLTLDCITCCCHPSNALSCSLSLNLHNNEDHSSPSPEKVVLQYNFLTIGYVNCINLVSQCCPLQKENCKYTKIIVYTITMIFTKNIRRLKLKSDAPCRIMYIGNIFKTQRVNWCSSAMLPWKKNSSFIPIS